MDSSHVAVATITWARSGSEEALLTRSLGVLAKTGLPVAIADRGTNTNFAEELKGLPGVSVTTPTGQGLVNQVQASVALASGVGRRFILYTEPDKELFFETLLTSFVQQAPEQADVGVVLASRSPESFATFPPTQRYTEGVINYLCTERLGAAGDYSYGPFLLNTALLPHLVRARTGLGWGWRHFMFQIAVREGFRLVHIPGNYPCPPAQRGEDDEERRHRMRQLSENLLGLIDLGSDRGQTGVKPGSDHLGTIAKRSDPV